MLRSQLIAFPRPFDYPDKIWEAYPQYDTTVSRLPIFPVYHHTATVMKRTMDMECSKLTGSVSLFGNQRYRPRLNALSDEYSFRISYRPPLGEDEAGTPFEVNESEYEEYHDEFINVLCNLFRLYCRKNF